MSDVCLPSAPDPIGVYERGVIHRGIGMVSGQFPLVGGRILHPGRLGLELSTGQGQEAARAAARNVLSQMHLMLGDWVQLQGLLRVEGVLACSNDFVEHPHVLDAASQTFLQVLGRRGRHSRSLIPVRRLPLNAPLELIVTFAVH